MALDPDLLRERLAGYAAYNAWEREHAADPGDDLPTRMAWLEEAYAMAERLGAIKPLPADTAGWLLEVEGIRLMHERLGLLGQRHG